MKFFNINRVKTILFLVLTMFLANCQSIEESATESNTEKNTFDVVFPILKDTSYSQEYVAELVAVQNVEIRAKLKGYLRKIYVDEGQVVQAGEVLFQIDNEELSQELIKAKAAFRSAEAEAKTTELEANNIRLLVEKNVVSAVELELAKAKWEILKAKVEEAKAEIAGIELQISFTEIKAPFAGIINRIPYKTGSLVDEGTLLTTLSDNTEIFGYFNLSEKEYLDFRTKEWNKKEAVALRLANDALYSQRGTIETIAGEFNQETGNIAVRVRFSNPDCLLKHGESGKIVLENSLGKVLLIPQKTVFEVQHKSYVYVVGEDKRVKRQNIVPQLRLGNWCVVGSGLTPKDKVLYEGIQLVKEGDLIDTVVVSEQTAQDVSVALR